LFRQATFEDVFISVLVGITLILFMVMLYFLSGKPDISVDKVKALSLSIQISANLWLLCGMFAFLFSFIIFIVGILISRTFGIYVFLVVILFTIFLVATSVVCFRIRSGYKTLQYSAWISSLLLSFVLVIPSVFLMMGSFQALFLVLKLPWEELWSNLWTIFHLFSLISLSIVIIFLFVNSFIIRDQFMHH
jgi:hypothetical protein